MKARMGVLFALATTCTLLALAPASHAQRSTPQVSIVGTWRLAEHWNRDSTGVLEHFYGDHPIGYLIHDATGHFSVQIMRTPPLRAWPAITDTAGLRRLIHGSYSVFGTFRVDSSRMQTVYHVEGSTTPTIIGTDVRFPYRISGDSLILGDGKTSRRVWLRVR